MKLFINTFLALLVLTGLVLALPNPGQLETAPDTSVLDAPPPLKLAKPDPSAPITIFTAKKILTMDPTNPEATAVAVQGDRIVEVGDLQSCRSWVTDQEVTVNRTFEQSILLPGFVEAHMHPHITGVLWQGVYIGRFDRYTPDGKFEAGLTSKAQVLDKLAKAAKKMGDNKKWLVAWGYQPEFYGNQPLTVDDLDPITGNHPAFIENASMHIYYVNSLALKNAGLTDDTEVDGIIRKNGRLTGELEELSALKRFLPYLPKVNDKVMKEATWNAGKLAHRVGVTSIADASFGLIPGAYKAYSSAAADPNFPVRLTLNTMVELLQSKKIQDEGGLDYYRKLKERNNSRLSFAGVKFVADGSVQGRTANMKWPHYYKTFKNGVANIPYDELEEWVFKVHKAGLQCLVHVNADQATEDALRAIAHAQKEHYRPDARHRFEHNQMVSSSQLERMASLEICTNLFSDHVYYWGDLHYNEILGPERAERMDPVKSSLEHGVHTSIHTDCSVTPLHPLRSVWTAVTRKTMSGRVLGEDERVSVEEALRLVTINAAYLMFEDHVKGSIESGKLADFAVLADDPTAVPVDQIKDIKVQATVLGGEIIPVD